ncbi:hypothetical protein LP52_13755 [Streptomonospora alba]|uniref:NB-ARC domain-containing protein n=1 Tax=Streptomonospora alba TaxID=183763 RepID=A0A0C2G4Q0_9ACTN|nr:FxSxx-COOH system tetratricopeptide repeat protein [Streptomonospora alba]KIH98248.1 hypothetical protein LP52_13755 [Streptomonospora alba]
MIEHLAALLERVDPPATAEEIAEAAWLARHLPPGAPLGQSAPERRASPPPAGGPAAPAAPRRTERLPPPPPQVADKAQAHLLPEEGKERFGGGAVPTRLPSPSALPRQLELARALRPLRQYAPSPVRLAVDEDATAAASAEQGFWSPRLVPVPERMLDVAVVVDTGGSMPVWRRTVAEFVALLKRQGAFRDVRVWRVDTSPPADRALTLTAEGDDSRRSPEELTSATGRRLVVVLSDCVDRAWSDGRMARLLELWGRHCPVAVAHLLPQRLWSRCAPRIVPVRLEAPRVNAPNALLRVVPRDVSAQPALAGVAVPVVEIEERWLSVWARLIGDPALPPLPGAALFTGAPAAKRRPKPERLSPRERVGAFRSAASPTAFKLACYLAAAPLSLPVMRLVQEAMLPGSTGAHLAEVMLSGLVRATAAGAAEAAAAASGDPAAVSYSYDPEVADTLISYLRRDEAYRVYQRASDALGRHVGSPDDFAGMLAVPPGNAEARAGEAFAAVTLRVLRALGGEYAAIAEHLSADFSAEASFPVPPTSDPHRGPTGPVPAEPPRAAAGGRAAHDPLDDTAPSPHEHSGAQVETPTDPRQSPQPDAAERVGRRPVIMNHVPKPNPNFTGREDLLLDLRGRIRKTTTTLVPFALHGMGGVGKSQAAVEFVHRFRGDYDLIWWIDAEQPEQVRASLVELAERLGLSTVGGTGETVTRVLDTLRRGVPYTDWLLVFDNAVYSPDTMQCVPHPTGDVLITSRDHGWSGISDIVEVDVLKRDESKELLTLHAGHVSGADADKIAEHLGDLPLALEQAAAWLAQTGMSAAEYLELLNERQSELLATETTSGYQGTVLTSLSVSIEEVRRVDPGAAELLMLCAYFSSEPIARGMLLRGGRDLDDPVLSEILSDRLRFSRTVRTLNRFALATIHPDEEALSIHRLARTLMREMGTPEERSARRRHAQTVLTRANPGDPDDRDNWSAIAEIARHVRGSELVDNPALPARKTVLDVIRLRYVRGDAEASKRLAEFVVDTWRDQHGPDDRHTLIACFGLANALRQLNDYTCIDLNTDTLERMRRVLGEDDEQTLLATNSHGADLRRQSKLDEALELDERNHQRHVRVFGRDHRATQRVANNLALDLRLHGRFEEARDLDRESRRIRAEVYGPTHDRTLYSANQLSRDLRATGEYSEALREIEGVIPTYEATLGPDHPDVVDARLGLAYSLRRMGRIDEALAQAERCIADSAAEPRLHYESVLAGHWVIADALRMRGDLARAFEHSTQAVRAAEDHFGPDHILTTIYRNNHSILLTLRGEHEESLRVNTNVAERIEGWRGRRHTYFLAIEANLASDRYHLGDVHEALRISDENVRVSVDVRGETHPRTQYCRFNHALDLRAAGYEERAEAEYDHAYRELVRMFGPDHPEVAGVAAGERQQFDIEPPIM